MIDPMANDMGIHWIQYIKKCFKYVNVPDKYQAF